MTTQPTARGEEPPMFLQRPSTGKSQDVRHILTKTFRELYTRDAIGPETVSNLGVSKHGDDPYHERYVDALQKVFEERQRRLEEAAMLERHIMQAQARAMSADERQLNRASKSCDNFSDLGLPPGRSHFRSCIDSELLKKHKLLSPEDYATEEPVTVPPPQGPKIPSYARETVSSQQHVRPSRMEEEPPMQQERHFSKMDITTQSFTSDDADIEKQMEASITDSAYSDQENFPKSDGWKTHMNAEQREMDRKDLANLQARVKYTRNPRFVPPSASPGGRSLVKKQPKVPKEVGIQTKPDSSRIEESTQVFLVSPPIVKFSDYKVGKIYEITLELKNVSTVMRHCTLLPPTTPYFNVGLGQFPGEHGLVAPGMSCHYAIRFAPDSLKDFDDLIKIQTQSSVQTLVPLQGRRQPPVLTMPSVLDVGYCLVGSCHVVHFIVKNQGGSGRFCIMNKASWPATNFKSVVTNGSVIVSPFEVRPSVLELMKGESGVIEVIFTPPSVKSYTQEMALVCDNCHVKRFTIKGVSQKASVELVSVERGEDNAVPGEMTDKSAEHLIRFDELNPFTYTDRTITVKNFTNVYLPFAWMIFKPVMGDEKDKGEEGRVVDTDSVFSVHPTGGNIPPAEEMEFKVTFAPPVVNTYHSVLHMVLQQIPHYEDGDSAKLRKALSKERTQKTDGEEVLSSSDEEDAKDVYQLPNMKKLRDLTALEVEVKGNSIPLNVVMHPYAVYVPGKNLIGTTLKKRVTMANHSRSTITFQWQPYSEEYILEIEPPFGELNPGMAMDLELCITGETPGKIDHTLFCYVMNLADPLHLHVEAEFKGPELMIEEPNVNFGLVRLGDTVSKEITLTNLAQITTKWTINDNGAPIDSWDDTEFMFNPYGGELMPLEQKRVVINFTPTSISTVQQVFSVQVEEGNQCSIMAYAEVQSPQVCLASCEICMENVYSGVPVVYHAILINQTLIPTQFKWGKFQGSHSEDCIVEMDPPKGTLRPREEKRITVSFVANRKGEFSDLRVPCKIEGMDKPLYLGLFSDVLGLKVSYKTSVQGHLASDYCDQAVLDYGEVALSSNPKMYLHINNESGITAPYNVYMESFQAKPPTPPEERDPAFTKSQQRRAMLGKTPNLADPLSKTETKAHSDLCKAMLMQGLGAAFVPNPSHGILQPFGEEIIEITAFSDMWGLYKDNIMCKVGNLDISAIPVSMNVRGCPLFFQMTAAKPDQKPIVRFGTHTSGVAATYRTMRIFNTSPNDIRVDWQVFNLKEDDPKLLDFVVSFGEAFPLHDESGAEIIPPWEIPKKIERMPTEFIQNSADTTPSVTREASRTAYTPEAFTDTRTLDSDGLIPNLVSVVYRPHEGVPANSPYDIKNKQIVIPAKGTASVKVSFTPFPTDQVSTDIDCIGYALGFMSLDKVRPGTENTVTRVHGYDMTPLTLDMTAHIKPALLKIEPTDEEGMRYRTAMSDLLMDDGTTKLESLKISSTMLSNTTETPLTFRLITKKSFLLVDLDPSSNRDRDTRTQETEFQTLKPQHNLLVKVAFQTTLDLQKESAQSDTDSDVATESKLDFMEDLVIEFNNTAVQRVPLHATLSVPQLELSKESLDFGTCLVGQRRELQLLISNTTASHSFWTVQQESASAGCSQDTFILYPSSGHLEAHITHVSDSKTLLRVYFKAKHAETYKAVFVFQGILGEAPKKLSLKGQGSYDERHEAILNV